jgi:hypothetical protein
MTPEPLSVAALSKVVLGKAGRQAAERGVIEASKRADQLRTILTGNFHVDDQEVTIHCPEQVETVSIAFRAKAGLIGQKVKFPGGRPKRAHLRPLHGLGDVSSSALRVIPEGFEIQTGSLGGDGLYLLDVEYDLESPGFVDALVERKAPIETPRGASTEYWLEAQLKHPAALRPDYGRFDLRDVQFDINVGIAENLKTVVPGSLIRELETAVALLKESDYHKKEALGRAHIVAMHQRGRGSTTELLGSLQSFFLPDNFRHYLDVRQDFRYGDCERGQSLYETLPIPTWPRSMKVISRTDLSLDQQAAHGTLTYKHDEFVTEVGRVIQKRSLGKRDQTK